MIFTLPTIKNAATFPSFPAKLRDVQQRTSPLTGLEDTVFYYEVEMEVDLQKCISNDCLVIEVDILPKRPEPVLQRKPSLFGSARSFTRSTKRMEKGLRAKKKKNEGRVISRKRVDITNYVSNSVAKLITNRKKISRPAAASRVAIQSSGVSSGKSPVISSSPLAAKQLIIGKSPIASSLQSQPVPTSISQRTFTPLSSFSTSLLSSRKDPAQIAKIPVKSLPVAIGEKAQSFKFTPVLASKAMPMYRIFSRKKTIKFRMGVRAGALKSNTTFCLRATVKNDKKVKLQEVWTTIQHSKLLNDFLTPTQEPQIEVSAIKAGIISVGVKQIDPKAKSVRVFRRTAPAETGGSDAGSPWTEIIETPLLNTDDELRFKDEFATSRTVIYRAIALGENMRSAEDFGSAILLPLKELKQSQTTALCVVCRVANNGQAVKATVSDIPNDAVAVMIRRYDLTTSSYSRFQAGVNSGYKYVGATPGEQVQHISGDESVGFLDKEVKLGNDYRYVPVAITRRGKEIIGTDALIEIPSSLDDEDKIQLTTPKPVLIVKNQLAAVSFNLAAEFTPFGFGEIKTTLSAAGQESLFDKDLFNERGLFAELISFLIERENFVTGEVESFGVYKAGPFEDTIDVQLEKNVAPLQTGVRYGYRVTALVRSPESLFPKLVSSEQDSATLLNFKRSVAKFRGPLSLRKSTLQSTVRQSNPTAPSKIEPVNPFLAGRTNVVSRVEVSIPVPKRPGYKVISENRGENRLVKWTYYGDLAKIDHFQVFASSNGGKKLLGTIHADTASANFMFRHFTSGYSVPYFYSVEAIRLDYKPGWKRRSSIIKPKSFEKKIKPGSRSSKRIVRL